MSRLSKEKLDEFYVRRIQPGLAKHGRGRPPWRKPTVLFILGQPGAGKTTMQAAAMDRLGMKKAYVLDHDELLEKHPEYARAALDNDYSATVGHAEDAAEWRGRALGDVQARRMDVVVPYPIGDLELMRSFQEQGYRVEVAVAAVHESQSQLGIIERFNDSRQEVGYGRWIDAGQHDQIYHDMLDTADAIEAQGVADAVHVYRRGEAEPVFTNEQKNGVWRHQIGSSRWAIETERNRPWTDREVNHFVRGYNKLDALARRPLKDHFKAMPLMATREGHRLLAKLQQTAAPKLAEHHRLTALRAQAEATRAAQPTQQPQAVPQQPQQPQQVPPPPRYAPHQQHVAQSWQEQAAQQPQQAVAGAQDPRWAAGVQGGAQAVGGQQVPARPQQGHDWERFAVRLQAEQSPASGISVPGADTHSQPEGGQRPQRGQGAARDERGGGDNGRLAR
ncbi:zeta toxin [Kribbella pratensis]|uniref:UDP-N-acetylglucosamine kinase n=1 Tax=Kribbella pratensis TaxID=2512112 RepID=A0ABY2FB87_9ACTN|nr:zeta toxin family protein [Kribbella pratensis]TDW87857.1 zeta toxin [Kribbella pratensis]